MEAKTLQMTSSVRSGLMRALLVAEYRATELEQQTKGSPGAGPLDSLTGLWTARFIEVLLPKEIAVMEQEGLPLSILLLDIDGLRQVNASLGPAAGDALLRDIGLVLKESLRECDPVGRWGGDGFLALLPATSKADALTAGKRIRYCLEQRNLTVARAAAQTGVSVGIASYPTDGDKAEELIRRAEEALKLAKKRGGNQICVHAGPVGGWRKRVGEYLMELGVCTPEQFDKALRYCQEQAAGGQYLAIGEALVKLGYTTDEELERALKLQAECDDRVWGSGRRPGAPVVGRDQVNPVDVPPHRGWPS